MTKVRKFNIPVVVEVVAPVDMPLKEVIQRSWEDIQDMGFSVFSGSGFAVKTLPVKRATVVKAISK